MSEHRITKATDSQKRQWAEAKELYPLFGYLTVKGSLGGTLGKWACAIEYLGEGKDQPNYEIHAPKGMHFSDGPHSLLGTTQADLFMQLTTLEECVRECYATDAEFEAAKGKK